ncbi:MAG: hypothetical protein AAFY19_13430, partial [Pseudomonadota bacterium]
MIKRALLVSAASLALAGCMTLSTDDDVARISAINHPVVGKRGQAFRRRAGDIVIGAQRHAARKR